MNSLPALVCKFLSHILHVNSTYNVSKVLLYPTAHLVFIKLHCMLHQNASQTKLRKPWAFMVFQNSRRILAVHQTHTHGLTDVRQRDPQREDDGEEKEIRQALTVALGPRQAQGLVFLIVFFTLFEEGRVEMSCHVVHTHTHPLQSEFSLGQPSLVWACHIR